MTSWLAVVGGDGPPIFAVLLFGFGVVLAIFLLLRHQWRRTATRPGADNATPSERIEEIRTRADASGTVQQAVAESTVMAQRLGAHLDNKAERLEQLIEEAERTIARLEKLRETDAPEPMDPAQADVDPSTTQIYALADQGLEPVEIAQRLDQHLGKVQLVLALRRA